MKKKIIFLGFFYIFTTLFVYSHDNIVGQIVTISKKIKTNPKDTSLYLQRGELYLLHKEYTNAKKDFLFARSIDSLLLITDYMIAMVMLENKKTKIAYRYINKYIKNRPKEAKGFLLRAKINQQLNREKFAKKDFLNAYQFLKKPKPKHYLEIVDAILYNDSSNYNEAISWLKKGEQTFNFNITLKEKEVTVLVKAKQYDKAIIVVNDIINHFKRKEKWQYKKAEIYEKANNNALALIAYNSVLLSIKTLPERIKRTSKMLELESLTLININNLKN